jgi:streptomycin 6-kinase
MFERYLSRWRLVPDGAAIRTRSSDLLPVRRDGASLMLKVAHESEERFGGPLMVWWSGDGAARVIDHDEDALLLERATGTRSLAAMAKDGRDDETSRIICAAAARLHTPRDRPPPELVPLTGWFEPLTSARQDGLLGVAADTARELLRAPQEVGVLHGDIHHENILDFGARGWLAIDPKGLHGERSFDFANLLRNPTPQVVLAPGRLARQAHVVAEVAHLDRTRLLQWTFAFASLSAVWIAAEEGTPETPDLDLAVAALAAAALGVKV